MRRRIPSLCAPLPPWRIEPKARRTCAGKRGIQAESGAGTRSSWDNTNRPSVKPSLTRTGVGPRISVCVPPGGDVPRHDCARSAQQQPLGLEKHNCHCWITKGRVRPLVKTDAKLALARGKKVHLERREATAPPDTGDSVAAVTLNGRYGSRFK